MVADEAVIPLIQALKHRQSILLSELEDAYNDFEINLR
jgi:hypothetical protein